jgi:serine phosphatase RsbU (regulator of sigma subunit)
MILYTDGFLNCRISKIGGRLTTLCKHHAKPVPAIKEELVKALDEHRAGHPQNDDITFVLLKRL